MSCTVYEVAPPYLQGALKVMDTQKVIHVLKPLLAVGHKLDADDERVLMIEGYCAICMLK